MLTMLILVAAFVTTTPDLSRAGLSAPVPRARTGGTLTSPSDLKVGLGGCATVFTVRDAAGQPVSAANIHARVRYGFFGVKQMELALVTDAHGTARIEGLPEKAAPLAYGISNGESRSSVQQDLSLVCRARYHVVLR